MLWEIFIAMSMRNQPRLEWLIKRPLNLPNFLIIGLISYKVGFMNFRLAGEHLEGVQCGQANVHRVCLLHVTLFKDRAGSGSQKIIIDLLMKNKKKFALTHVLHCLKS